MVCAWAKTCKSLNFLALESSSMLYINFITFKHKYLIFYISSKLFFHLLQQFFNQTFHNKFKSSYHFSSSLSHIFIRFPGILPIILSTLLIINYIIISEFAAQPMADKQASAKKKITLEKLNNLSKISMKLIKQLALTQKSKKISQQTKVRMLADLNANLAQIQKIYPLHNQNFADEQLIIFVRHFFIDNSSNKIPPIQFFRRVLVTEAVVDRFIAHSLPLYIVRVIERDEIIKSKSPIGSTYDEEAFEALRLIKHWLQKFPNKFPQYLAFSLIAFAQLPVATSNEDRKKDQISQHLKIFAIDIVLIMATKNTKLCCICGGFSLLLNEITETTVPEKSYDIISKMLIFVNDPKYREITSPYIEFKRIFHVLTDLDNVFLEEGLKSKNNLQGLNKFQLKVGLAKNAIITLLKSWVGLIYIGNDPTGIRSLLETLKQIPKKYHSQLRNLIFQVLQQIICVGDSIITASKSQEKHLFKISNLIGCYLMTVVELLISENLLKILIQLSGVEQSLICEPSQRLLKRLTFLIFSYRPQYSKYIDFLITAANRSNIQANQVLKISSSFVINKIGNYIYDKKQKKNHLIFNELENLFSLKAIFVSFSRSSLNSISKTLNFLNYKEKSQFRKLLFEKDPIPKQFKQNFIKWKWDVIQSLLQFPDLIAFKPSTSQRYRENKMYKYLLKFYSPSVGNFYKLDWHLCNFAFIKVAMLLIRSSITIPQNLSYIKNPPQSQFECTVSYIGDLQKSLEINIGQCLKNSNDWNIILCTKLQRELIGLIGILSETKLGYQSLICKNRFIQILLKYMDRQECSHLIYLVLINFDFYRENVKKIVVRYHNQSVTYLYSQEMTVDRSTFNGGLVESQTIIGPRYLLQVCLKKGSLPLKLGCLEIVKILVATEVQSFIIFSYQLLINLFQSESEPQQVIEVVIQFLEESLIKTKNVQLFIKVLTENINFQYSKVEKTISNSNSSSNNSKDIGPIQVQEKTKQVQIDEQFKKNMSQYFNISTPHYETTKVMPKFETIKQKLTNPILIRLLSNDTGIQLADRYFPDWLNEEFDKWVSPDHNYCSLLQSKLNAVLNFAKKKEKGYYKISTNNFLHDLFFIYKLPWVLHANQRKFPLWVRQRGQSYQLYATFNQEDSSGNKFMINNDSLKISLGIGTMLVDEQFNVVSGNEMTPLTIFLAVSPKQVKLHGKKAYYIESNGVQVYYRKYDSDIKNMHKQLSEQQEWQYYNNHVQDLNKIQILHIIINVKLPTMEYTEQLPLHLINQLTKTQKGWKIIENRGYIQKAARIIENFLDNSQNIPTSSQLRSTLWSLGFIGSRGRGIKILSKKKIFDNILKLTFSSQTLSIRGTCRYVLNMFTHSEHGRKLLIENGFIVNSSCFTCYPIQTKRFYVIERNKNKSMMIKKDKYWEAYTKLQRSMSSNEQKLFEMFALLINSLSFKSAVGQIRQILKMYPKLSYSINLFQNVINLLTFFKYKHESRKSIMNVFEDLIKNSDFNNEGNAKIVYFINQEELQKQGKDPNSSMPKAEKIEHQIK